MDGRKNNHTLQGLLRFALEQTQSEDASNTTTQHLEMDEQRKEFLENAFKNMTIDIVQEFEQAISVLNADSSAEDDKLNAIKQIREYIDNIDFANSFIKVGGGDILLLHLKAENSEIRINTIYIVAEMSQNNPFCQKYFVDSDVLPLLLSYFVEDGDIASSAVHAVSALVRSFEPGLVEFLRAGGIKAILSCLNTKHSRLFIKACFFIACISSENVSVRDEFVNKSAVPKLFDHLDEVSEFDVKTETTLFALSTLSKSTDWNLKAEWKQLLQTIIGRIDRLPECQEMMDYAKLILERE